MQAVPATKAEKTAAYLQIEIQITKLSFKEVNLKDDATEIPAQAYPKTLETIVH